MRVVVGRIGRAQGIRGEVTVEVRTDAPEERFSPGAVLLLSGRTGLPASITVAGHRWQNGAMPAWVAAVGAKICRPPVQSAL